jgi:hypothetical protein
MNRVKREFGVSRWGWLAELRLADIDFRTEKYPEAVSSFRSWIRYHPTQPEVTYARFMIAKSHFMQIPQDWLLVPSAWERDLGTALDAQDSLRAFLRDNGQSEYGAEARRLLQQTRAVLGLGARGAGAVEDRRGVPLARALTGGARGVRVADREFRRERVRPVGAQVPRAHPSLVRRAPWTRT